MKNYLKNKASIKILNTQYSVALPEKRGCHLIRKSCIFIQNKMETNCLIGRMKNEMKCRIHNEVFYENFDDAII